MVDVSVVVIVYNDEKRLPTAVQSVLNQHCERKPSSSTTTAPTEFR